MFRCTLRALPVAAAVMALAACSGEAPQVPMANEPAASVAPAAPVITDESGLQAAAARALSEQRFYAPAGESALDHYLALRELRPDDANLATALLELLPYAVIGTEQAVARQDLAEARRLLDLLERADPQAPSLRRLRDSIAAAQVSAEAAAVQALAEAGRAELARLAAAREAQAAAAQPAIPAAPAPSPAPAPAPAAGAAAATASSAPVVRAPVTTPAPSVNAVATVPAVATTAAASPSPTAATAIPRLLTAPSPRYPIMALRRKLEGQVTVQFTIQPDGSVVGARVVSADPAGVFDEAALVAASRWRFEAGLRSVGSSRVVRFRLGEGQR